MNLIILEEKISRKKVKRFAKFLVQFPLFHKMIFFGLSLRKISQFKLERIYAYNLKVCAAIDAKIFNFSK